MATKHKEKPPVITNISYVQLIQVNKSLGKVTVPYENTGG